MAQPVQFELFATSHPRGIELVQQWHQRAKMAAEQEHYDSFDVFTRLWTGFNNWGLRVTEADTDAEMVRALAQNPALNRAFSTGKLDRHAITIESGDVWILCISS